MKTDSVPVSFPPVSFPWVTTPASLKSCIERRVPQGAKLEWVPQDTIRGGEPLQSEKELGDLRKVCAERKIDFVHIPAG